MTALIAITTVVGCAAYVATLSCGRIFASLFALWAAAAVPLFALS